MWQLQWRNVVSREIHLITMIETWNGWGSRKNNRASLRSAQQPRVIIKRGRRRKTENEWWSHSEWLQGPTEREIASRNWNPTAVGLPDVEKSANRSLLLHCMRWRSQEGVQSEIKSLDYSVSKNCTGFIFWDIDFKFVFSYILNF